MPWPAILRLTALLCAAGLAASRLGLILHELVGHGGFAIAQGGEITDLRLFWFAGGWISYEVADPSGAGALATSMGGLIVELVLGGGLFLALARRDRHTTAAGATRLGVRILRGAGLAITAHAWWYFATGTWHGYGDGLPAHRGLGEARYPVAIAAGVVTCVLAFGCARLIWNALAGVLPARRLGGLAIAMASATVLLATPVVIELRLRGDARYGAIMKREGDRLADRELALWQREQQRRGVTLDPALARATADRLRAEHREPPFMPVLGGLVLLAIALGARRASGAPGVALTRRHLAVAGVVAAGSLALVIALDTLFH